MSTTDQANNTERLAQLETELSRLKQLLPEHCGGTEEYVDVHRASIEHWQKIEDMEEEIKALKAAMA